MNRINIAGNPKASEILSKLLNEERSQCPDCGELYCASGCETEDLQGTAERLMTNAALDTMDAMAMALVAEGMDPESPILAKAIVTTRDAIFNNIVS